MAKTDNQMAIELADEYKSHQKMEEELFAKYENVSRAWMNKLCEGIEDSILGEEMDLALQNWQEEKKNVDFLARATLKYVFKAGIM